MKQLHFALHQCPFCQRLGFDNPAIIAHLTVYCRQLPDRGVVQCPLCPLIVNIRAFDAHAKEQHYAAWRRSLIV